MNRESTSSEQANDAKIATKNITVLLQQLSFLRSGGIRLVVNTPEQASTITHKIICEKVLPPLMIARVRHPGIYRQCVDSKPKFQQAIEGEISALIEGNARLFPILNPSSTSSGLHSRPAEGNSSDSKLTAPPAPKQPEG